MHLLFISRLFADYNDRILNPFIYLTPAENGTFFGRSLLVEALYLYREYPPGCPLTSFQSLLLMFHLLVLVYILRSSYLGSMGMLSTLSGERKEPRGNACGKAPSSPGRFSLASKAFWGRGWRQRPTDSSSSGFTCTTQRHNYSWTKRTREWIQIRSFSFACFNAYIALVYK